MKDALRIAGYAGTVVLMFGLLSFAFSGRFDLWTAVHVAGGGIAVLLALASNLGGVLRAVAARGTRQRAQAVTGALVFATFLIVVNVLASRFPRTWDVTEDRVYTLGEKTLSVLSGLDKPVELVAFVASADRGHGGLDDLLKRYAAKTRNLTYRMIDPEREPQEADRFGVTETGVLAAQCGAERAQSYGSAASGFDEGEVTSLILKVARPGGKRIYAITGHGEPNVDDRETAEGLGALAETLKDDNLEVVPLLLATAERIPGDAAAVLLAGPVKDLIPHELNALRAYLAAGGRLLALIDPGTDVGLGPLLADYRLALEDTMIVDREEIAFLGARLGLDPLIEDFPPHPITRGFKQRVRLSQARSVAIRLDGGLPGVVAEPVARTRASAWGEGRWKEMLASGRVANEDDDAEGPLLVAAAAGLKVAADGTAPSDAPPRETRLVLVGDADWVVNGNLGAFFNREMLANVVHWLTGSEDLIVGPPKRLRASRLDMTTADQRNLFRFGVLLLPEVLLIGGIVAWLRRRSL